MDVETYDFRDALPTGPVHRRAAGLNPGNRFETVRLHVLGEELDRQWIERQQGESGPPRVEPFSTRPARTTPTCCSVALAP